MYFREYPHYNIVLGSDASRFSTSDEHGSEYFVIVPMNGTGKQNRENRHRALELLESALEAGVPGEVKFG